MSENHREIIMAKGDEKFIFNDEGITYIWGKERAELTYEQAKKFFKYY